MITYEKRNSDLGVFNCLLVRNQERAVKVLYDEKYRTLGAIYLLYDIMLMAAHLQQPLIRQCCKFIAYNKQHLFSTPNLRLSEYAHMHKRIRSVETCLLLIERLLTHSNRIINSIKTINPDLLSEYLESVFSY